MLSLYEILKASKTGIASDMWTALAGANFGGAGSGAETKEITGIPPLSIRSNGTMLLDYLISGNMSQAGTPTPDNPIMPQGCGNKTANLFDKSKRTDNSRVVYTTGEIGALFGVFVSDFTPIEPNTTYTLNIVSSISGKTGHLFALYDENKNFVNTGAHEALSATVVYTFTTPSNVAYIRFNGNMSSVDETMLNLGSAPLPYEPYGIKIPISSANTTTTVYLGEVESTRRIKKLVLTGNEAWNETGTSGHSFRIDVSDVQQSSSQIVVCNAFCTHYVATAFSNVYNAKSTGIGISSNAKWIAFCDLSISGHTNFKSYLTAQYAAGTPVTVWYVLAKPTTGIVNEPLRKIGDYADTLSMEQAGVSIPTNNGSTTVDVETTLKPSEVYIKYKG